MNDVYCQLGHKSTFGKWVLIIKTDHGCEFVTISKAKWEHLRDVLKLPFEG